MEGTGSCPLAEPTDAGIDHWLLTQAGSILY